MSTISNTLVRVAIAPVPGGCNIEASVPVAPWLGVGVTGPTVVVTSAPAQAPAVLGTPGVCDPVLHYQTYHLYLPEKDFTSDTYFQFISKMLTVKRITDNARKVSLKFERVDYFLLVLFIY